MSVAEQALWIAERNAKQPLMLNDIAAAEVEEFENRVADLVCAEVPPQPSAVFDRRSHVSKIFDTYRVIWNEAFLTIKRTAADWPSLELHNDSFDPSTGLGGLRTFIPLTK